MSEPTRSMLGPFDERAEAWTFRTDNEMDVACWRIEEDSVRRFWLVAVDALESFRSWSELRGEMEPLSRYPVVDVRHLESWTRAAERAAIETCEQIGLL